MIVLDAGAVAIQPSVAQILSMRIDMAMSHLEREVIITMNL